MLRSVVIMACRYSSLLLLLTVPFLCVLPLVRSRSSGMQIMGCDPVTRRELDFVVSFMQSNWYAYNQHMTRRGGGPRAPDQCERRRIKQNTGRIRCDNLDASIAGQATLGSSMAQLNSGYLRWLMRTQTPATARACMTKLIVHEFAHTCGYEEVYADQLDAEAYQWLRTKFRDPPRGSSSSYWQRRNGNRQQGTMASRQQACGTS